jgi:hypothetical protein
MANVQIEMSFGDLLGLFVDDENFELCPSSIRRFGGKPQSLCGRLDLRGERAAKVFVGDWICAVNEQQMSDNRGIIEALLPSYDDKRSFVFLVHRPVKRQSRWSGWFSQNSTVEDDEEIAKESFDLGQQLKYACNGRDAAKRSLSSPQISSPPSAPSSAAASAGRITGNPQEPERQDPSTMAAYLEQLVREIARVSLSNAQISSPSPAPPFAQSIYIYPQAQSAVSQNPNTAIPPVAITKQQFMDWCGVTKSKGRACKNCLKQNLCPWKGMEGHLPLPRSC